MLSGRIRALATVTGLFASIVGIGAFAIVSLAPMPDYVPPPRGTFLQDPGPGSGPAPPVRDEGPAQAEPPPTSGRAAAVPARPARPPRERSGQDGTQDRSQGSVQDRQAEAPMQGEAPAAPAEDAPAVPPSEPRRPRRLAAVSPQAPMQGAVPGQSQGQGQVPAPALQPRPPAAQAPAPPRADPRLANVLTPSEIRKLKLSLRLTPEQEQHWPPVEAVLAEIGAQQMSLARAGQNTADAFSSQTSMRIYWAAKPLLGLMREDQKAQIRVRARAMGLESVASYL